MAGNFTYDEKLVYSLSDSGWFANPAGIEGHEVIVVEKKATEGTRYYTTLHPGETLRLGERVFGRYQAYAVDMRSGRSFPIEREFTTSEGNRTVAIKANVRYRVMDSKKVALHAVDPLSELRDKVIATLARELARWPQTRVTHEACEKIVLSAGYLEALGLNVDGAEVLELNGDRRVAGRQSELEQAEHEIQIKRIRDAAELKSVQDKAKTELEVNRERIAGIDLRDPNAMMHMYPDTINAILQLLGQRQSAALDNLTKSQDTARTLIASTLGAYIQKQNELGLLDDPNAVADMVRDQLLKPDAMGAVPNINQITFGDVMPGRSSGRIEFGGELSAGTGDAKNPEKRIQFGGESK